MIVHSFSGSRFAALSEHVTNVESLVIDLDQLGRAVQATLEPPPMGLKLSAGAGMMVPAVTINPSLNLR
jgi:hypothetical protein